MFDEPGYVIGHRTWYEKQQQAIVATMRSGRFKVHPIFIPIINRSLLDKVPREYLIQFMVHFTGRGEAEVYKAIPSRFDDSVWHDPTCKLKIEMLDASKCQKTWCYSCKSFKDDSCQLLRAQYEHKKKTIQDQRYVQDLERSKKEEDKQETFEQLLARAYENLDDFYYTTASGQRRLSTEKVQLIMGCSQTKAQRIRQTLKAMTKEEVKQLILKRLGLEALA